MSRIVVVGGHGRTGKLIIEKLVAKGETVVATIRNPKHMAPLIKLGVEAALIDLDTSPLGDIEQAFKGADAVVFAAGSAEGESSALDRKGVVRTIRAAEKTGVKRYVAISSLGATTPVPDEFDTAEMKDYFKQKRAANKAVHASELKWTIIEPGTLGDGKGTGKIAISEDGIDDKKIARADVAAVVVAVLDAPKSAGHTMQIVAGSTAIATAVKKIAR